MYNLSSDWVQKINITRQSSIDAKGNFVPIRPIEPDAQFFQQTIGVYISSQSASPNWYAAGDLFQAFLVGFGTAGYAQGEYLKCILNRYMVYKLDRFPFIQGETRYLLSFTPKNYLKDIRLQVWEYQGTNQGISNEDLHKSVRVNTQLLNNVLARQSAARELLNKINKKL